MSNFTKYSNYDKNSSFSSVVFGADSPILEVELNEMQQIMSNKIANVLKVIGTRIYFVVKPSVNVSQKKFTLNSTVVIDGVSGNVLEIDTATVTYSSTNKELYLQLEEKEVAFNNELRSYGNTSGAIITNTIKDDRVVGETSRRRCLTFTLCAGTTVPTNTSTVRYVSIATSSSGGTLSYSSNVSTESNILNDLLTVIDTVNKIKSGDITVANSNKLGNKSPSAYELAERHIYSTMSQDELTGRTISNIESVSSLVNEMEDDKSVLFAYSNVSPSWYPSGIPASGCMLTVIKTSPTRVMLYLNNVANVTQSYIAGYNGSTFTGWYSTSATAVVVPASVEE